MKKLTLTISFLLTFCLIVRAETLKLSTYYPAPFGSYDRLRLVPRAVAPPCDASLEGLMYYSDDPDNFIKICYSDGTWRPLTGVWTQDNATNSIYPSETLTNANLKVGIGKIDPAAELDVEGSVLIADTLGIGTRDALINDLLVVGPYTWEDGAEMNIRTIGNIPTGGSILHFSRARGVPGGASLPVLPGDIVGAISAWANTGGLGARIAGIHMEVDDGIINPTSSPGRILFKTTPDGAMQPATRMLIKRDGNVGIGTLIPESLLHLSAVSPELYLKGSSGADYSATIRLAGEAADNWQGGYMKYDAAGNRLVLGMHPTADKNVANDTQVLLIDSATGNIGIQRLPDTTATDYELAVQGTIYASGGDLAENILVETGVGPGDVVVIAEDDDKKLKKSDRPYDPTIAGVISTDPGFCLAEKKEGYQPLALTGQVPVKATTENGPIKRGDLLTSSSKPGYAMKAEFISLEDTPLPGLAAALEENRKRQLAIIGKALEELAEGEGTIVILMAR